MKSIGVCLGVSFDLTDGIGGAPASMSILDADGNSFSAALSVLDADGNTFTITNAMLDADGNSFTVI
jgi:hypothetical protein